MAGAHVACGVMEPVVAVAARTLRCVPDGDPRRATPSVGPGSARLGDVMRASQRFCSIATCSKQCKRVGIWLRHGQRGAIFPAACNIEVVLIVPLLTCDLLHRASLCIGLAASTFDPVCAGLLSDSVCVLSFVPPPNTRPYLRRARHNEQEGGHARYENDCARRRLGTSRRKRLLLRTRAKGKLA